MEGSSARELDSMISFLLGVIYSNRCWGLDRSSTTSQAKVLSRGINRWQGGKTRISCLSCFGRENDHIKPDYCRRSLRFNREGVLVSMLPGLSDICF